MYAQPADKAEMVPYPPTFRSYFNDKIMQNEWYSHSETATCSIHVEPLRMPKSTRDLIQTVRIYVKDISKRRWQYIN